MINLTSFQKRLCNVLQNGLPIVARPFDTIAGQLGSEEAAVLAETKNLIAIGIIRRISASINYKVLGKVSVLITAHVDQRKLTHIVAAVNMLGGVSHNYLRDHFYNLWFTLQGDSEEHIGLILAKLAADTGTVFHSLPVVQTFRLDVRFDAESDGKSLLPCSENDYGSMLLMRPDDSEKTVLSKFQQNLEIVPEPFSNALPIVRSLIDKGIIRRVAAVVNYRTLGFAANAMFVCAVDDERCAEVGRRLAASNNVSHCYQRRTFPDWQYNLFGMMHGRDMQQLETIAAEFVSREKIRCYAILKTLEEFKKIPVKI
ncbi:MAG: hypothetical protein Q7T18_01450 [Sedimentisphaerales bacterium]|nr:hypothetical protein [Sedimentisphaerales bacterium]